MDTKLYVNEECYIHTWSGIQPKYPEHNVAYKHVHHGLQMTSELNHTVSAKQYIRTFIPNIKVDTKSIVII